MKIITTKLASSEFILSAKRSCKVYNTEEPFFPSLNALVGCSVLEPLRNSWPSDVSRGDQQGARQARKCALHLAW